MKYPVHEARLVIELPYVCMCVCGVPFFGLDVDGASWDTSIGLQHR